MNTPKATKMKYGVTKKAKRRRRVAKLAASANVIDLSQCETTQEKQIIYDRLLLRNRVKRDRLERDRVEESDEEIGNSAEEETLGDSDTDDDDVDLVDLINNPPPLKRAKNPVAEVLDGYESDDVEGTVMSDDEMNCHYCGKKY